MHNETIIEPSVSSRTGNPHCFSHYPSRHRVLTSANPLLCPERKAVKSHRDSSPPLLMRNPKTVAEKPL